MRSKNVFFSLTTSIVYQIVLIISNFIIVRLMISTYGSEVNGLNSSIQQLINYINIVEAGIALTAIQSLYRPLVDNNWKAINSILVATKNLYTKTGIVFILFTTIFSFLYPVFLNTDISYSNIVKLFFVMAGGSIIEYFLNGKLRVLLMADQKSYMLNFFQTLSLLFSTILKIVLINIGAHYIIVQSLGMIALLLRYILSKWYIKVKYKEISFDEKPDYSALKNRWSVLFHQFSGLVIFNSPIIIISIFVGLEEASIYSVYNIVFSGLLMIITMFSKSTVASFGNLLFEASEDQVKTVFNQYQILFFCFGLWLYTVAFLMTNSFVYLYTKNIGEVSYIDNKLVILFSIIGLLNMIRVPNNTMIEAAGHYKQTQFRAFLEAIINLIFSLALVQVIGIYGVLVGGIISFLYRSLDIIIYSSIKILKISPYITFRNVIINFIFPIVFISFAKDIIEKSISNWYDWFFIAMIVSLFVAVGIILINAIFNRTAIYELRKRFLKK